MTTAIPDTGTALETSYLGLQLKNPIVPSASPLSRDVATMRQLEDSGAAAIVLYSLFEEEIRAESSALDRYLTQGAHQFPEAVTFFPEASAYSMTGPQRYLEHIRLAKEALDIPIIASLNGSTIGGWIDYAREIEQAGADALELNIYFLPTDLDATGTTVEQRYIRILGEVRKHLSIPIAMKLSPYFSATANMAQQLVTAGANGLVFFNRFYQPDLDLEALEIVPNLRLSSSTELRLPLRWIAILYGRLSVDFSLTTGVHTAEDALKGIAAGASVTMMASALLKRGIPTIGTILAEMSRWLDEHEYESVAQLRGSLSQINCPAPSAFERANYIQIVGSYDPPIVNG